MKNQQSFKKIIEIQLAQIATSLPASDSGKIPSQPENVNVVTTRGGNTSRDPPYPNNVGERREEVGSTQEDSNKLEKESTPQNYNLGFLPFPSRARNTTMDEQFSRFIERIQKVHVNVPLLDVLCIPLYAKYIKDIINKK